MFRPRPRSTLFPYTTLFRSKIALMCDVEREAVIECEDAPSIYEIPAVLHREGLDAYVVRRLNVPFRDRKSTRLNSSHVAISYAVFCLKKKRYQHQRRQQRSP